VQTLKLEQKQLEQTKPLVQQMKQLEQKKLGQQRKQAQRERPGHCLGKP